MRAFSYAWSLPVTWRRWQWHHSICRNLKLRAVCKFHDSMFYGHVLLPIEALECGNRLFLPFACSVPPFRRISALKSTSPSPVRRVSTGYVNYDGSDGHSIPSLRRHLFSLSSQLVWMATMPCWPGRQGLSLTGFSQRVLNAATMRGHLRSRDSGHIYSIHHIPIPHATHNVHGLKLWAIKVSHCGNRNFLPFLQRVRIARNAERCTS